MTSFSLHLILCNLFIAFSILAVTAIKHLFKNHLSARAIYRLWSVLFVLMALPFIPVRLPEAHTCFRKLLFKHPTACRPSWIPLGTG